MRSSNTRPTLRRTPPPSPPCRTARCCLFSSRWSAAPPSPRRRPHCPAASPAAPASRASTSTALANGLQVLLMPDASKPTITVNVTYLVGSRTKSYGETGMAHLLEHLLFKGTPRHPDIMDELTRRGARSTARRRSTAPTTSRLLAATDDTALDLAWRPTAWSTRHLARGPRQRDDGGAQRVRARREQPARVLFEQAHGSTTRGTTTATPRSASAPTSRTSTSTGCRPSTAPTTSPTTRC